MSKSTWLIGLSFCIVFYFFSLMTDQVEGGNLSKKQGPSSIPSVECVKMHKADLKLAKSKEVPLELNYPLIGKSSFIGFDVDGTPRYYANHSERAAIGSGINLLWTPSGYDLNGENLTVGIWDEGAVRTTHEEFSDSDSGSRVTNKMDDADILSIHSTHVTGILVAEGKNNSNTNPNAPDWFIHRTTHGMANQARSENYEFANDYTTMPEHVGAYLVTNHSYGALSGWGKSKDKDGHPIYLWYGGADNVEDPTFGSYGSRSAMFDEVAFDEPFSLMVASAGNDRNDNFYDEIESLDPAIYYRYGHLDEPIAFDRATAPKEDGQYRGGFGTIDNPATAKNIVTVGAINDMVDENNDRLDFSTKPDPITGFSGWGPCDDGRIKPDLVAMGGYVYSPVATSDTDCDAYYGTSQAAPVVSGSSLLLQEFYERQVGYYMHASTVKSLLLHTAYDLGRKGPDYSYGWGYLDAEHAIHTIEESTVAGSSTTIQEGTLSDGETKQLKLVADGNQPLVATLVWTDPAHAVIGGHDDSTPALVNDLDLRISSANQVFQPWILDRNNPDALAVTGDNCVDNVEQVVVATPSSEQTYNLSLTHKDSLLGDSQNYSLVISGIKNFYLTQNDHYISPTEFQGQAVLKDGSSEATYNLKVVNMTSQPTTLTAFSLSDSTNFSTPVTVGTVVPAYSTISLPVTYRAITPFSASCGIEFSFDNGKSFDLNLYAQVDSVAIPAANDTLALDFGNLILGSDLTYEITLLNETDQEISITSVTEPSSDSFSVEVDASQPIGSERVVTLSYHPINVSEHSDEVVLEFSNGGSLSITLSGSSYLFDIDDDNDTNQPPVGDPVNSGNDDLVFNSPNVVSYTLHPGWNLISIPFTDVSEVLNTFSDMGYEMWKWDITKQCYVKLNNLAFLEGIWVCNPSTEANAFDFVGLVPPAPTVRIQPGWGLYGSSKISETAGFPSFVDGVYQWIINHYLKVDQINPVKAYWFFNKSSQEELLPL
jgi:hypothetical protein